MKSDYKTKYQMKDIAIYGAGGFGRETALLIKQINRVHEQWNIVGFFDDGKSKGVVVDGYPVLGGINEAKISAKALMISIAIANPSVRKNIVEGIGKERTRFPSLIHPSADLGDVKRNSIGYGCIVTAANIITTNVHIGNFSIVNLMCTIGHDVTLGDFTSIMPGCSLSGSIRGGDQIFIGTGARILPDIQIGEGAIIGAGAVVTKNVKPFDKVVGVPARPFEKQ